MVEFSPIESTNKVNFTNTTYKPNIINIQAPKESNTFAAALDAVSVPVQNTVSTNPFQNTQTTKPKAYPNPYDNPDPNKPVDQDPCTWKDFPTNINSSKKIQEAYKDALKNNDGYKLLQLAKIECDNTFTYGSLSPNKMVLEAYNIAVNNKDPFLTFHLTQFNLEYNFSSSVSSTIEMFSKTHELGLERKDVKVLNKLADLEDRRNFMENVTPKEIRKQALFINNKDFTSYPNPYDNPDPNKQLDRSPFIWKDFPSDIDTEYEMNQAYKDALKNNDGYKLLQLAKIELNSNCSKEITPEILLKHAYNIASYNKDPYLLLYVSVFEKNANLLQNVEPSDIFRKAYNTSIERRDSNPLYLLYIYEKRNDFLSELTPTKIMNEAKEIEKLYKEPLI